MNHTKKKYRFFGVILLAAVLAAAILVGTRKGKLLVPNLYGKSVESAVAELEQNECHFVYQSSETHEIPMRSRSGHT